MLTPDNKKRLSIYKKVLKILEKKNRNDYNNMGEGLCLILRCVLFNQDSYLGKFYHNSIYITYSEMSDVFPEFGKWYNNYNAKRRPHLYYSDYDEDVLKWRVLCIKDCIKQIESKI